MTSGPKDRIPGLPGSDKDLSFQNFQTPDVDCGSRTQEANMLSIFIVSFQVESIGKVILLF